MGFVPPQAWWRGGLSELDQACLRARVLPGSLLGPEQMGSLELQGEQEVLGVAPSCADPEHTWDVWGGELRSSRQAGGLGRGWGCPQSRHTGHPDPRPTLSICSGVTLGRPGPFRRLHKGEAGRPWEPAMCAELRGLGVQF